MLPLSRKDSSSPYGGKPDNAMLCVRFVARRYLVFGISGFVVFSLLLRMLYVRREPLPELVPSDQGSYSSRWPGRRLPPLYGQYHAYEHRLPQHHWNAPSHASEPKYFWVAGHGRGSGWGNVMQEILLNAHLSYKANRAIALMSGRSRALQIRVPQLHLER
ncbi:hypothetical protein NUW54_g13184 [Trametes sanguinea]|uniref:Uncharacterized protein n=1 Tax=Trametes sanguinea TaxID=158606 RepID=A0ACC1MPS7_9APHY|nr:hypothetical protein NUW54_g13184 [Trametes sanguinea]